MSQRGSLNEVERSPRYTGVTTMVRLRPVMLVFKDGLPVGQMEGQEITVYAGDDFDWRRYLEKLNSTVTEEVCKKVAETSSIDLSL